MRSPIGKLLYPFLIGYIGVLAIIVGLYLVGGISTQEMGFALAITFVVFVIGGSVLLRRERKSSRPTTQALEDERAPTADKKRLAKKLRAYKIAIFVLLCLLVNGLLVTRGDPLLPRIIGTAIDTALIGALVAALRTQQRRLKR